MSQYVKRSLIIAFFIIITTATLLFILFMSESPSDRPATIDSPVKTVLQLRLENNKLYLFSNSEIIKEYDINQSVLPGEDIKLLLDGITVETESDADEVAENFDG